MAPPRVPRFPIVCEVCGGMREYTAKQLADRSGRFCSVKCANSEISKRPDYREKQRQNNLRRPGHGKWMVGRKMTEKNRLALRLANRPGMGRTWKLSDEVRRKMSEAKKGDKSYLWKGGITPEHRLIRATVEYKLWRKSVFERDNYTCVLCGARGVKLHADHIQRFAEHPELRFVLSNGRTLCVPCHKATPTWGRRPMAEMMKAGAAIQKLRTTDPGTR